LAAGGNEVRKTVTVLFADVTGSTSLGESIDSESQRGVMSRYFAVAQAALERHGGTIEKFIGDAVMAVFGVPDVHEDDALRAARAAVDLQAGLATLNGELETRWSVHLQVRIGVNTGDVVSGDPAAGQTFVTGDAVNVAARLQQAAQPGEILIGAATVRLVRDAVRVEALVPLSLKGKSESVEAFRLLEVISGAPAFARRLDSPMVGRDAELGELMAAFERANRGRGCELVTVFGVAGVGKSRLISELLWRLGDQALVLEGQCLPYGDGITFWPVAEIVKRAAGIDDADPPAEAYAKIGALVHRDDGEEAALIQARIGAAIGLRAAEGAIQETFWAFRRFLEILATDRPVVAVISDIHWAQATLLDLIEYVAAFSQGHPVLLLCTARPELREARPDWGRTGMVVVLQPLPAAESERLIENLLGQAGLIAEVKARIVDSAEGNPLFVEEMLRMLIDDGLLRREAVNWVATDDMSRLSAPRTIQALIAARLDRLHIEERGVVQRASVVGRVFYWGAVTELSPVDARGKVGAHLQTLQRKELILPEASPFAGEDGFRFSHILIRDAAYQSMPKRIRAELHERFASWLERVADTRVTEYEEILGYHLEQAHRNLAELGPPGEHGDRVAAKAATRLASAGGRALARGDMPAAADLLSRAAGLLARGEPARVRLLPELATALTQTGAWQEAEAALTEAVGEARLLGDRSVEALATVRSLWLGLHTRRFAYNLDALPELRPAIATFEELEDDGGLAEALTLLSSIHFWCGQCDLATEAAERAIEHSRRAGDRRREYEALRCWAIAECFGPLHADEAARRFETLMREPAATEGPFRLAILRFRAEMEAIRGNFAEAHDLVEAAKSSAKKFGLEMSFAGGVLRTSGYGAMLAGEHQKAEKELAQAVEILRRIGDLAHLSSVAPLLAEALYEQRRYDEALPLTEEALRTAIEGDVDAQVNARRVRAKILARLGRLDEAVQLATQAVDLSRPTDFLDIRGLACADLAEVLLLAGQAEGRVNALTEALEMFERKGNQVMARRVRAELATT
jgi:predicted ATPase/class 3 adenylate cyclase